MCLFVLLAGQKKSFGFTHDQLAMLEALNAYQVV